MSRSWFRQGYALACLAVVLVAYAIVESFQGAQLFFVVVACVNAALFGVIVGALADEGWRYR